MKVLLSAIGCQPGETSEGGAGWAWARAAAQHHDVWLLTRSRNASGIEAELRRDPTLRIRPVYLERDEDALERGGPVSIYARYLRWQRAAGHRARHLHEEIGFDVVHHVTYATDFMSVGVASLKSVPLVVGPLGGSTPVSLSLWLWLGPRGFLAKCADELVMRGLRRVFTQPAVRQAAVALALNDSVARRFRRANRMIVEPNAAVELAELQAIPDVAREQRLAVFVGRLVPLKGLRLAITALREDAASDWRLEVLGDGPERGAAQRFADDTGVSDRVTFRGWCSHTDVLIALRRAHCLLYPSLFDSGPWVVAEAVSLGTPVVCFDGLGPAALSGGRGGILVPPGRHAPRRLAEAMAAAPLGGSPSRDWLWDRLPGFLDSIYTRAVTSESFSRAGP